MAEGSETTDARNIQVIELNMMDKSKYYPLALLSGACIRTSLYPLSLVKTRLQVQNKKTLYNGTWDAFKKITRMDGVKGLYRGYWVNSLLIFPQMAYISVYEGTRQWLQDNNVDSTRMKSFVAGGCASIASQTFVVPLDIVTQHMMLLGSKHSAQQSALPVHGSNSSHNNTTARRHANINPLNINVESNKTGSRVGTSYRIIQAVYHKHGLKGFYKGYFISLLVYAPHSALWWLFYDKYSDLLADAAPDWVPRLVIQCLAAPLGGCTATLITNPLDVSRTRIQVTGQGTLFSALSELWRYEGMRLFTKAITARLAQSTIFSFTIILGYETIKRWSLLEEHKADVKW